MNERVNKITAEAKEIKPLVVLLTFFAGFFYVIGWVVGKIWLSLVWCLVAIKLGYEEAANNKERSS